MPRGRNRCYRTNEHKTILIKLRLTSELPLNTFGLAKFYHFDKSYEIVRYIILHTQTSTTRETDTTVRYTEERNKLTN